MTTLLAPVTPDVVAVLDDLRVALAAEHPDVRLVICEPDAVSEAVGRARADGPDVVLAGAAPFRLPRPSLAESALARSMERAAVLASLAPYMEPPTTGRLMMPDLSRTTRDRARDKASKTLRISFSPSLTDGGAAPSTWFTVHDPQAIPLEGIAESGFVATTQLALFSDSTSVNFEILLRPV